MKNTGKSLYFLAIIPENEVCEEVNVFKNQSAELFKSKAALRSPPHITLHMPFQWRTDREDILIEKLAAFRFEEYPFELVLDGFDFFPPRVAFVNVIANEKLNCLQAELVKYVRREFHLFNADYKDRPFHPHMTVAFRDLSKVKFKHAREHFSQIEYHTSFIVNGFHLLKHNGKKWETYKSFSG